MSDIASSLRLDPASPLGVAGQIRAGLALLINDGRVGEGQRLPSVRTMARHLGVNVNTVRAAYARLEADGLVTTRHGVGTLVSPLHDVPPPAHPLGTNAVAVLVGGLDPFYLTLLRAIEEEAAARGTLVLAVDTRDSNEVAAAAVRQLAARGVDGIIAASVGGVDAPRAAHSPAIVYVDQPGRAGYGIVFDGVRAGYIATRHLLDHGHDRVALLSAPLAAENTQQLRDGYVRALSEARADTDPSLIAEADEWSAEAGRRALAKLLDLRAPPSAVFVASAVLTLGALEEARARGADVPSDLAVVGYSDFPVAELLDLTMVAVPVQAAGRRAMRTLLTLIDGREPRPRQTVLDVDLVVRRSCGSHRAQPPQ